MKGKHYSEEEKDKLYASRRVPKPTMRGRIPANARKIICVESGAIYESLAAAKRETGIKRLDYYNHTVASRTLGAVYGKEGIVDSF